jgi:putative N6-adenine-specific DNA methylase
MELIITTMQGLEPVLEKELRELGAKDIVRLTRAVGCQGDLEFLYRANLCLRTALRVLKPIHRFTAQDERIFYDRIQEIHWPDQFRINQQFAVHAVVNSTTFRHGRYIALKTKDAIVDQFRDKFGRRPNVSTYEPDLIVNVHISEQDCTLSLDSSGESLHKRAYKVAMHEAPINEVLAAGLLLQSGFEQYDSFYDPMCGSGTFLTEALMIHTHCPPNLMRDDYAFMKWADFEPGTWQAIKEELRSGIIEPVILFSGADIDRKIMFGAKKNLVQLPFGDRVELARRDFLSDVPEPRPAFLILNPPYDVRLESDDILKFYGEIGTQLKHQYTGSRACVFTGNLEALKKIGLRPTVKLDVLNGAIPSKCYIYDLFEGKRAESNPDPD